MKLPVYKIKRLKIWTLFYKFGSPSNWENWQFTSQGKHISPEIIVNTPDLLTNVEFNFRGRLFLNPDRDLIINNFEDHFRVVHQVSLASFVMEDITNIQYDTLEIFTFSRNSTKEQIVKIIKDKGI